MEVPNKTFPMDVMIMTEIHAVIETHNIYGTQMARATYHGVKDLLPKGLLLLQDLLMQGRNVQFLLDRR
jgi:hypothetical protein